MLQSVDHLYPNSTYIGMTNNTTRRLRQHNGIIKGGARATTKKRPYEFCCIVTGFLNKSDAMSYEWNFKYPYGKKHKNYGKEKRMQGIKKVLETKGYQKILTVNVCEKYINIFENLDKEKFVVQKLV